jgi:hypothetical protein
MSLSAHNHQIVVPAPDSDVSINRATRTVRILNFYRLLGTVFLSVITVIGALGGIAAAVQTQGGIAPLILIILTAVGVALGVLATALFYASVGWLADTLALLARIAGHIPPYRSSDVVAPQGVNEGSGREVSAGGSDEGRSGETIGGSEPGEASAKEASLKAEGPNWDRYLADRRARLEAQGQK